MKRANSVSFGFIVFPVLMHANQECINSYEESHVPSNVFTLVRPAKSIFNVDKKIAPNNPASRNIVDFETHKRKTLPSIQQNVPNRNEEMAAKNIEILSDLTNKILSNSTSQNNLESLKLTQNKVWRIHANYSVIKENYLFFMKHPGLLSEETFLKLEETYKKAEEALAKTNFFKQIEEKGYSLVPGRNEVVKELLPQEVTAELSILEFNFSFLSSSFMLVKGLDSIYFDKFRRNLLNGGERRRLAPGIELFLERVIHFLDKSTMSFSPSKFDYEEIMRFINSVDVLINSKKFSEYHNQNLKSYFSKTRNHSENVSRLLVRYNYLRNSLRNNGKNSFVNIVGTSIVDSRVTYQNVEQLRSDLLQILREKSGDSYINYEAMLDKTLELTSLIKDSSSLDSPETLSSLQAAIQFLEQVISNIPKRSFFGIGMFTLEEIDQANRIRAEIDRLKKILPSLE